MTGKSRSKDGWKQPEVAKAQRALAETQMADPMAISPFKYFIEAMRTIRMTEGTSLLDVGCGVGHYAHVCRQFFPRVDYCGADYSRAMIAEAKDWLPDGNFKVKPFDECNFWDYDIVLLSQVLEYLGDPVAAVNEVLTKKHHGHIILNRLRLTDGAPYRVESEPCYCGFTGPNFVWNLAQLIEQVNTHGGKLKWSAVWGSNATLVVSDYK
jgi:SAM-dependent methyltransferase